MAVKTYNAKKVLVTFLGVPLQGYADGSFVSVERTADAFTKHVGADGEVARSASADRSGTITITLLQTSPSNDLLAAAMETDERTNLGFGPVSVTDASGRTLAFGANAWLRKPTNVSFSKEVEGREWTIDVADLQVFAGGN